MKHLTKNRSIQKRTGFLISLEGVEGAGKSSQVEFIAKLLLRAGRDVLVTREPGGTHLGENIRRLLLMKDERKPAMYAETELLLMFAARAQHLHEVILPALQAGKAVISDRFTDSSYAYQGGGRGIDMKKIKQLDKWCMSGFKPDLTLLLDIPVEIGLSRIKTRSFEFTEGDRIEAEVITFFQAVREAYLQMARCEPQRISIIQATQSPALVQAAIAAQLRKNYLC